MVKIKSQLFYNSREAWKIQAAVLVVLFLISVITVAFIFKSKYVMHLLRIYFC